MSFGQAEPVARPSADAMAAVIMYDTRKKRVGLAYVLWLFLGGLGAHRFYAGRMLSGAVMAMLTVGGWLLVKISVGWILLGTVALWGLVDAFLIPGMIREANARLALGLSGSPFSALSTLSTLTSRSAASDANGVSEEQADAMIARYLAKQPEPTSKRELAAAAPVRSFGTRQRAP